MADERQEVPEESSRSLGVCLEDVVGAAEALDEGCDTLCPALICCTQGPQHGGQNALDYAGEELRGEGICSCSLRWGGGGRRG